MNNQLLPGTSRPVIVKYADTEDEKLARTFQPSTHPLCFKSCHEFMHFRFVLLVGHSLSYFQSTFRSCSFANEATSASRIWTRDVACCRARAASSRRLCPAAASGFRVVLQPCLSVDRTFNVLILSMLFSVFDRSLCFLCCALFLVVSASHMCSTQRPSTPARPPTQTHST